VNVPAHAEAFFLQPAARAVLAGDERPSEAGPLRPRNNMAAVSADGSTVCVLILRLNSSCSRSTALVVRALRHWLGGKRVKVKSRSPASSRLLAILRRASTSFRVARSPAASQRR
jgi:hypothetical protein